jgi:predicted Zn-dependent peptidase
MAMRENRVLYPGYWLERFATPLGSPDSVGRIAQDDLQAYYDTHYAPANMSIVGVGGLTLDELVRFVSESPFAVQKEGKRTQLPTPAIDIAPPSENRYVFELSKHLKTEVPFEVGGYRSVTVLPAGGSNMAIRMLSEMLDEVLAEEVRERRAVTYDIGTSFDYQRHFYEFVIECGRLEARALAEIESVIEECIGSIDNRADLFEKEKQGGLAASFMIDQSAKSVCEGAMDDLAKRQKILSLADDDRDLRRLTMDDVRALLKWLKPERRWTGITIP